MMVLGAIVSCSSAVDPAREPTLAKADGRAGWPSTWRTALSTAPNTWAATVRGAAGNASTSFRPIPVRRARSRARVTQARPVRTARSPQTIPATAAAGTGRVLRRLAFTSGVRDGQRCRPECHRAAASARAGQAQERAPARKAQRARAVPLVRGVHRVAEPRAHLHPCSPPLLD